MGIPGNSWNRCFSGGSFPTTAANGGLSFAGTRDTFGIHGDILAGPRNLRPAQKRTDFPMGGLVLGCFQKIGGQYPKMDGENNGNPPIKRDDLGGKTHYFRNPPYIYPTIYYHKEISYSCR